MSDKPKVVFWDLETLPSPREVYKRIPTIGAWPGRTFNGEVQTIMSFGYKIQGEAAKCVNLWDFPGWDEDRHNDAALVHFIAEMLNDADEIITHNGKRFDLKVLNARLSYYGMMPPPKIKHVDTKTVAKSHLALYSYSLDSIASHFGVENKIHWSNKWSTWEKMAFKEETKEDRKLMSDYCKQDVETLYQVYNELRPYIGNQAVNKNHWVDPDNVACNVCMSKNYQKNGLSAPTTAGKRYQRYRCMNCGNSFRTDLKNKNPRSV